MNPDFWNPHRSCASSERTDQQTHQQSWLYNQPISSDVAAAAVAGGVGGAFEML